MDQSTLHIIAETPHYLVVDKPAGLPTVPLKSRKDEDTLLSRVAKEYPEVMSFGKNGWEGGILHRLDTPTNGLVLVARDEQAYDRLRQEQDAGMITKEYLAVSSRNRTALPIGFPIYPYEDVTTGKTIAIGSLFRPFGENRREVRPVREDDSSSLRGKSTGVWYLTKVKQIGCEGEAHRFLCQLTAGFRHQVRVHLAWAGWPLDGDANYRGLPGRPFGLTAVSLAFSDPETGRDVCYRLEGEGK